MKRLRAVLGLSITAISVVVMMGVAFVGYTRNISSESLRQQNEIQEIARNAILKTKSLPELEPGLSQRLRDSGAEIHLVSKGQALMHSTRMSPPRVQAEMSYFETLKHEGYDVAILSDGKGSYAVVGLPSTRPVEIALLGLREMLWVYFWGAIILSVLCLALIRRSVESPLRRMTLRLSKELGSHGTVFGGVRDIEDLSQAVWRATTALEADRKEFARQNQRLEEAKNLLVRAEKLAGVGQLAAGVAHEIGNPLTIVSGYLSMVEDVETDAQMRSEILIKVRHELDRISGILRDLLDYSRLEADPKDRSEILAVFAQLRDLLRPQSLLKSVDWRVEGEEGNIFVAPERLIQVLLNLCLNAAHAMDGGGKLRVHFDAPGVIAVEDSGPGIEASMRKTIFQPFYTTKDAGTGTGLGLAVCETIVTAAGGEIWVEESALGGARFVLRFMHSEGA